MMPEFHAVVLGYPSQPPKFVLTQRVLFTYEDEHGEIATEQGFITGIIYDPTQYCAGWTYMLATYQFSYAAPLAVPYYETAQESDLEPLNS